MIADGAGRAIAFRIAPGQLSAGHSALLRRTWALTGFAHELPHAVPLLDCLPDVPLWVVAERGYTSHCSATISMTARIASLSDVPERRRPCLIRNAPDESGSE